MNKQTNTKGLHRNVSWLDTCQQVIDAFIVDDPVAWRVFLREMTEIRQTRRDPVYAQTGLTLDKHGAAGQTRWVCSFPNNQRGENLLIQGLLPIFPDLLTNERKFNSFCKHFPVFIIGEKV